VIDPDGRACGMEKERERMKRREIQTWRDREREIEREGKVENGEN